MRRDVMKAFVAYDKTGRVTSVGIPNPKFGDEVAVGPPEGGAVVAVDVADVVKSAKRLTYATGGEKANRLQEVVRKIALDYRVDPATGRLLPK
jgi:hypothetical protein